MDVTTTKANMELRDNARSLVGTVLEQVNSIRVALAIGEGKIPELPKGVPNDSNQCVLAKALSNGWIADVDGDIVELEHKGEISNLDALVTALENAGFGNVWGRVDRPIYPGEPKWTVITFNCTAEMRTLITAFDRGLLPELILE